MKERRSPFPAKKPQTVTANTQEAASDYVEGLCPVCQQKMVVTSLKQNNDRPVYVCLTHRVCLPLSAK